MKPVLTVFCFLLLSTVMSCSIEGADLFYYWNATDGDFNTSTNWTPGNSVPGYTGGIWVIDNNGTANITADVPDKLCWILPGSDPSGGSSTTVGMVNQSAGVLNLTDRVLVAYNPGSYGVYHMTGGTVNANTNWTTGTSLGSVDNSGGNGGIGIMSVAGTATFNAKNGITFGGPNDTVTNILNIGVQGNAGGTVVASSLWTFGGTGLVNFHGGTYKPNLAYGDSLHKTTNIIYSEGATIDTNGVNIGIQSPLVAPSGNGVLGFQLDTPGSGYTSAPIVKIEAAAGGSGMGATAVATIDPGTGAVTGIVITNPGTDYNIPPTVTLIGGGGTGGAISIPTSALGTSSSGGLTKKGAGTLSLTAPVTSWGVTHTYTGATVVEEGTLFVDGFWVTLNTSGIEVRSKGTLSGFGTLAAISAKAGGTLDPGGGSDVSFSTPGLTLYDGAKLSVRTSAAGPNYIDVQGNVGVGGTSGAIRVDFNGTTPPPGSYPLISYTGTLSSSLSFLLEYDSVGAAAAEISTASPHQVTAIFSDLTVANRWSNGAGGNYDATTTSNWTGGVVPLAGDQRAIFADVSSASGDINVSLKTNPTLSSLLFNNSANSYKIGSTTGNFFTLNSSIAFNNLITVMAGSHEINVPVKMSKNTRIQVETDATLTLGNVVSEDVGGARILTKSGPGTLKLLGANTYTGATVMTGGGTLEAASVDVVANANSLGKSGVAPANLVLDGTFRYVGAVNGSTDRGFTLTANTILDTPDKDLTFSGQIVTVNNPFLYKTGSGTLTFSNAGPANYLQNSVFVQQGTMAFHGGADSVYRTDVSLWVGDGTISSTDTPAMEVQSGALSVGTGMYVGRGVTSGAISRLKMTGGTISANRMWMAANHDYGTSNAVLEMSGDSQIALDSFSACTSPGSETTITMSGYAKVSTVNNAYFNSDTSGAKTTVTMSGHSEFQVGTFLNCGPWGAAYTGSAINVTLQDDAKVSAGISSYGLYAGVGGDSKAAWTLKDRATLSVGDLRVGRIQNASGAIYQYGGTFQATGGQFAFGGDLEYDESNATYGYYALANGTAQANCQVLVGTSGTGVVDQSGGSLASTYSMLIGCKGGAMGVYNLTGGNVTMNDWSSIVGWRGDGVLNLSGTAKFTHRSGADGTFYAGFDGGKGVVNLGTTAASGGILETYQIARGDASTGTVNFHGGTLMATASSPTGSSEFLQGTDNYIYGEGAIIDTNGFDVAIATDLRAPTGKGVQNIAFNPLTDGGEGYIGAPTVVITAADGDSGTGATAKTVVDVATGKITAIVMTNPGVGYTTAPTVSLRGGGSTVPATVGAVTLADNLNTGGLKKLGLGSLTLTANLSYAGDTAVNAGTLNVTVLNTPAATVSVATGATLNATSLVTDTLSIGGPPVAAAVPEPGTLLLLALAGLSLVLIAGRRQ